MTRTRRRVLEELAAAAANGEELRLAELARRCGLHSYRDARRTKRDLERLGLLPRRSKRSAPRPARQTDPSQGDEP
jgi:DNA-binding IclR family transcriptional regulator